MILIILGPTAIGKTSLAINLAKAFDGELISADSRQVYKGMDIVTGKDKSFPDHGIDLVYPDEPFSVNHWLKHTQQVIKKISRHKKLPIIVGGTGFYLNALLKPPQTLGIKPNPQLRQKLEKLSLKKLQSNSTHTIYKTLNTKYLIIGLRDKLSLVDANVEKRVYQRLKVGALKEAQKLFKKYGHLPVTLGYSQLKQSFSSVKRSRNGVAPAVRSGNERNEVVAAAVSDWITAERQYVRRQLTYFKKIKNIHWFKPSQKKQIVDLVKNWYYQLNND